MACVRKFLGSALVRGLKGPGVSRPLASVPAPGPATREQHPYDEATLIAFALARIERDKHLLVHLGIAAGIFTSSRVKFAVSTHGHVWVSNVEGVVLELADTRRLVVNRYGDDGERPSETVDISPDEADFASRLTAFQDAVRRDRERRNV